MWIWVRFPRRPVNNQWFDFHYLDIGTQWESAYVPKKACEQSVVWLSLSRYRDTVRICVRFPRRPVNNQWFDFHYLDIGIPRRPVTRHYFYIVCQNMRSLSKDDLKPMYYFPWRRFNCKHGCIVLTNGYLAFMSSIVVLTSFSWASCWAISVCMASRLPPNSVSAAKINT